MVFTATQDHRNVPNTVFQTSTGQKGYTVVGLKQGVRKSKAAPEDIIKVMIVLPHQYADFAAASTDTNIVAQGLYFQAAAMSILSTTIAHEQLHTCDGLNNGPGPNGGAVGQCYVPFFNAGQELTNS
jgi:hypothetical protein